jgi:hypothetical protein
MTNVGAPPPSRKPIGPTILPESSRFKPNTNMEQAGTTPAIASALG